MICAECEKECEHDKYHCWCNECGEEIEREMIELSMVKHGFKLKEDEGKW